MNPSTHSGEHHKLIRMKSLNCNGGVHGKAQKSKDKLEILRHILCSEGPPDVCLLQHTGVVSKQDAKRLTQTFGRAAVGVHAGEPGKQNTGTVAVIFPRGAEDVQILEVGARWLTVEATVHGTRIAVTSVYLSPNPQERRQFLRARMESPRLNSERLFIAGDWNFAIDANDITERYPQTAAHSPPEAGCREWAAIAADEDLVDVAKILGTAQLTHTQKVAGGKRSAARLDRWYTPARCFAWVKTSNSVTTDHYDGFDHHVLSLIIETVAEEANQPRPVRFLPEVLATAEYEAEADDFLTRTIRNWPEAPDDDFLSGVHETITKIYKRAERKWVKSHSLLHREAARELQALQQKLLAAHGEEMEASYSDTRDRLRAEMRTEVYQSGTQRLYARNKRMVGRDFFNQNKKKRGSKIGSLAAYCPDTETFDIERTSQDTDQMVLTAKTHTIQKIDLLFT
eukprot:SAG31_NODE_1768_length_7313_cov_3.691295_1_plen_455_part_00